MKLSIITINYNNLEGLKKTLDSIFLQTWKEFEYIVIDGGSTDGSKELIEENADKIDYWVSDPDKGIYNAMNKGIKVAKGEYLLFLNSGDWLYENIILEDIFNNSQLDADILYGDLMIEELSKNTWVKKYNEELTLLYFCYDTLPHQGSFIKRKLFIDYSYREDLSIIADWYFFLQQVVVNKCSTLYLDRIISHYNLEGISASSHNREQIIQDKKNIIDKMFYGYFTLYQKGVKLKEENAHLKVLLSSRVVRLYFKFKNISI